MAQKPDGKAAGTERVVFTRPAAERISKAVRIVEAGDRDGEPLRFDRNSVNVAPRVRLGTFTGNWDINTYKTVTIVGTTQTVSVFNWCNPYASGSDTPSTNDQIKVLFSRVNGTISAVEIGMRPATGCIGAMSLGGVDLSKLVGFATGQVQLLGHGGGYGGTAYGECSSGLQWFSITTCATAAAS